MRSVYDFTGSSYRKYAVTKRQRGMESKMAALSLSGYQNIRLENALTFLPYFVALQEKMEGNPKATDEMIAERLNKAKKQLRPVPVINHHVYPYENAGLDFKMYRPYDPDDNGYDCVTYKAVIDHRITDQEKRELEDELWIHFYDPYCDGRDCTGAPFTSWIRFFCCTDRTIVIHRISYDV